MIRKIRMAIGERLMRGFWGDMRSQIKLAAQPGSGGIAFVGDSITHMGKWDLLFPSLQIRNLGIGGERSSHLLERTGSVIELAPQKIFILIGTNDLGVGVDIDETTMNVATLLDRYRKALPDCRIYLQGVMPRQRKFAKRVARLNGDLRAVAQQRGIPFIELVPAFDDGTGQLRAEYTTDVLHLNGAGYMAWRELLKPHLMS